MVTVFEAVGLVVLIGINTLVAAVLTRVFRVRLNTRWGGALYTLLLTPLTLVVTTLVLGQVLGPNLGSPTTVIGIAILLPLTLGIAFDYFWMPSPEEVDMPDTV
jgi:hypothetical protein